jgi:hypothetical protein
VRPLKNTLFYSISTPAPWNAEPIPLGSGSNFNPQNTQCIPACPACPVECEAYSSGVGPADRTGVVKIFAFLDLGPRLNIKYGFNWAGKNEYFLKVSN